MENGGNRIERTDICREESGQQIRALDTNVEQPHLEPDRHRQRGDKQWNRPIDGNDH